MAKYTQAQVSKAVALHKQGKTYEQIAKAMRLGSWQIAWHLAHKSAAAKTTRKRTAAKPVKRATRRAA